MIFKQKVRLKYILFFILPFVAQGLTGCLLSFRSTSDRERILYAMQKEKTSTSPNSRYRKIRYFSFKKNFWYELKKDFLLVHYTHKPQVKAEIRFFLQRSFQLQNTIKHKTPYMHYVYEQLKKRHLPAELMLIPFIESTYDLKAVNKTSGASGLWQLTPRTAQRFGVRQDLFFDGKYDLYASTHAALDYLTYLNQLFCGNWLLTLAAYDAGEGTVRRAMEYNAKRRLSTSFWDLPLTLEATHYVPKILALSAIVKNPEKYGLKLFPIFKEMQLEQVDVAQGISVIHAAALANINIKQLRQFNPGFKQLALIPKQPYRLVLPAFCVQTFQKNQKAALSQGLDLKLSYYLVKPGDTLNSIAKQNRITTEALCLWNELKPKQVLPIHKRLVIIKMPTPYTLR